MCFHGINGTAGFFKIIDADTEMILKLPGGIGKRYQVIGFVEVTVGV